MWPSVAYISMNHWFPVNFLKIKAKLGRHKDLFLLLGLWLTCYSRKKTDATYLLHTWV